MTTNDFLQAFIEFLGRNGWPADQSPWTTVEQWESLVEQVAEGYQWGLYEFTNDLGARDLLEKAFTDDQFSQFAEIDIMCQRVEKTDVRLKSMFTPGVEIGSAEGPWWRRGVLATACNEYRDDMKRLHGIEIHR